MRHWKDFSGQPTENPAHHAGAFEAEPKSNWFEADKATAAREQSARKPAVGSNSIEEVTDRIFRRYAVH